MKQNIKDVMLEKVITVPVGTMAMVALELMAEHRIRHLPVTDNNSKVIGILSKRDLANSHSPVEFFMSSPVVYLDESASLQNVIFKMLENKISCVLVRNTKGEVSGIVTTDDLLWHLASLLNKDNEKHKTLLNVVTLETVGNVMRSLSDMGI